MAHRVQSAPVAAPRFAQALIGAVLAVLAALPLAACSTAELQKGPDGSAPADPALDGGAPDDGGAVDAAADDASSDGAAALPMSHAIRIQVQPSDQAAALVAAVRAATKSVHVTMYLLTSTDLLDALVARKRAGVDVKVILNQTFPQGGTSNQNAFDRLKNAGVGVVWGPVGFNFVHSKVILLDEKQAWIMTMNATQTSPRDNREYIAVDDEAADVAQAETIFRGDYENKQVPSDGVLVVAPTNAQRRILALVASATRSLDVEAESLADTGVVDAILAASARGVAVRVILSTDFSSPGEDQAVARLKAAGVPGRSLSQPYVHAKAIVADGARAYVGSVNFTTNSMTRNREMGVLTDAPDVKKIVDTMAADFAAGAPL